MMFALSKWSFCAVFAASLFSVLPVQAADDAAAVIKDSGVRGGFVAHLNCGDGTLTAGLKPTDSFQVQGLTRDASQVAKARTNVAKAGLYGDIAIDQLTTKGLP